MAPNRESTYLIAGASPEATEPVVRTSATPATRMKASVFMPYDLRTDWAQNRQGPEDRSMDGTNRMDRIKSG